ncbi:MAG TPA: flagellar basal body-associated FliL family protein [Kofleriaceae bacterium]|nr:flagellar basal body-associated FliL family protein [Kofleriaceae bacterium]
MSDAPEGDKPAAPAGPKPKTSLLVLILLLANLGSSGFAAYEGMQAVTAQHAASAAGGEHGKKGEEEGKKKEEVGPVTPLEPFIVNLNEPEATRYLKATFELEVADKEAIAELDKLKRPVRDDVLRYLSSLSVADTQGEAGKAKIQKEVVSRIDRQLGGKNRARRLFFVEFMVQ